MNTQIQIELWPECRCNRCKFCNLVLSSELRGDGSHTNPNRLLTSEEKCEYLDKAIAYLHTIDWNTYDTLLLRGGEVFNEYQAMIVPRVEIFIHDISALIKEGKIKKVFLVTGLKYPYENSLLGLVINLFKANSIDITKQIMIGTSWDSQYRFTDLSYSFWKDNMEILKHYNIEVHVTSILTEDFIHKYWKQDKEILKLMNNHFDFIAPQGKPELLSLEGFFPKRTECLKFLQELKNSKRYSGIWKRLLHQNYRRAESIYFTERNELQTRDLAEFSTVFEGDRQDTSKCGHPAEYACYQDSDACFLCDINMLETLVE